MADQNIAVRLLDPRAVADWDERIGQFPDSTFFHTVAWARVLADAYGFRPAYIVAADQSGGFRAVIPLIEVNSWLTGRRGISLPFTDECAPLARDPTALRAAVAALDQTARARSWKYWEIRGGIGRLDVPASVEYHGHQVSLDASPAGLLVRCDNAVRSAIKKAERSGLRITFAHDPASAQAFHRLLCLTRRRHGVPPQPFRFFECIQRLVLAPGHGTIVLAWLDDRPVAGAMYLFFRDSALFKFGGSDETHHLLRPNNLVMWRMIERLAQTGFQSLDFGRTSLTNAGLRRFKLSWGANERRISYARFDCRRHDYVTVRDASEGWHTRIFKIVPGTLARFLGAAAYKHVA